VSKFDEKRRACNIYRFASDSNSSAITSVQNCRFADLPRWTATAKDYCVSRYGVRRKSLTLALEDLFDDDPDSPLLAVQLELLWVNPSWAFACKRTNYPSDTVLLHANAQEGLTRSSFSGTARRGESGSSSRRSSNASVGDFLVTP
jgi:hypothetical protein